MPLTLYGSAQSRTMRVLWCATELQLDFEHVPWAWDDPRLKHPEFLQLTPAGAIPTLVDDGFALSDSHLARWTLPSTTVERPTRVPDR